MSKIKIAKDHLESRYLQRGVSAHKDDVRHAAAAFGNKGIFAGAFCLITEDILGGVADWCAVQHADGAGSKSALAYLYYKETGDLRAFEGLAQDALVMNTDDMLCVGALGPYLCSNTVGRSAQRLPSKVLDAFLSGLKHTTEKFKAWGVDIHLTGGETADVGDIVRTLLVDITLTTRLPKAKVIDGSRIAAGDVIVGLASAGKTTYEEQYNSGIGSNGLTSARHDLLWQQYATKYPETMDDLTAKHLCYSGPFNLAEPLPNTPLSIGQALLSPTRSYLPIIKPLLEKHSKLVSGLVHCTGGGQTKCLRLGRDIHYIKDRLFQPPPIFQLIKQTSQVSWPDMYQVFNMGHRMEVIGDPKLVDILKELAQPLQLEVQAIGYCKSNNTHKSNNAKKGANKLSLKLPSGTTVFQNESKS